jgi:hypothetical protein
MHQGSANRGSVGPVSKEGTRVGGHVVVGSEK